MEKRLEAYVGEAGKLEQFLRKEMKLTQRQIRQAKYRESGICVNGIRSRISYMLKPGDLVSVLLEEESLESTQLISGTGELEVLYEDEDILAVNKPAGIVVHPSHGHYEDSLSNMAAGYFRERGMAVKIRPVGRLDKDTSGIVLFAKNQVAAARLSGQKASGIYDKEYLALVQGIPAVHKNTICTDLAKDADSLMKMKTTENGLHAITHYEVLQEFGIYSLLRISIDTGRTHQIRVHMASIGHPLLGDHLYGTDRSIGRTALHASFCRFVQPFTEEAIEISAELPGDMKELLSAQ